MDRDKLYLQHIVEAIKKIRQYTGGISVEDFKKDALIQDGVVRQLEIIGEAARVMSEETKKKYPEIPWYNISGMRNRLIHEYFQVDIDAVWKTVTEDLGALLQKFEGE
ncbi:MAG TPA: DUF86 domain-containing protein [Candidatus Paceibacterota bacterium]|nr:DUF86 domain-containing protein [Candidatus Paceibacterota bacterium]